MTNEKTAPTAEEIAAARKVAKSDAPYMGTPRYVRTLLAALDAAEAREKAAYRDGWDANVEASREILTRAETAERERDEARALAVPPGAIVVRDSEETRERIARELWGGEGYSEPWGEAAKNSHPVTYRCVLRDTDAVLAALREARL